jgi:hypothetical protein
MEREGFNMASPSADQRSADRQSRDERIATETQLPRPNLPADAVPAAVERYLTHMRRQPIAIVGVVENGLVRPLNPTVKLPEHSRVIIVAEAS